jgi:hypothetical protein
MALRNDTVRKQCRIEFRVGINLGDIRHCSGRSLVFSPDREVWLYELTRELSLDGVHFSEMTCLGLPSSVRFWNVPVKWPERPAKAASSSSGIPRGSPDRI